MSGATSHVTSLGTRTRDVGEVVDDEPARGEVVDDERMTSRATSRATC
jgi:hypothetical protein